ncbi:hypothetical protein HNE_1279 [Hyphomonas neptunium ATCC 15444]|uniref:EF-hand domain-containing protein n=2 Tax=Hyphomonas TaxID=85 RepID=Q0C2P6_HYPNA|nr:MULTISPECIES: hypothetical protein [Hyphomonas]ABI78735.1 hypothetical protein HNE_1279 [Hyphomonas neptunium ATCC 15444]KCZ95769.1 hypothetical protein HHI_03322 [Hyphomonas hirschiana VP5]
MIRVTLISAAALVGAMGAQAGEKVTFAEVDTNADGFISATEFIAHKTADGKVTEEKASAKFESIAGMDGQISEEDWDAAMEEYGDKKEDKTDATGETTW